jgi:hypothetical protein
MELLEYGALAKVSVPTWATAVVGSTVLSAGVDVPPRIEVEVRLPASLGDAQAAFAAVCGSYDDHFHDPDPVDSLVRVGDRVLRVTAEHHTRSAEWSGTVEPADRSERAEMARWRRYRSVEARWGWGGWDADGFRISTESPYAVAGLVHFGIVPLDGLELAVVQEPLTPEQRAQLGKASRPPWIDVLATSQLLTDSDAPTAHIEVDMIRPPDADPTTVAAAVAASYQFDGRFDVQVEECIVRVMDEKISVAMESDLDPEGNTWSVLTRPVRRGSDVRFEPDHPCLPYQPALLG